MSDVKMTPECWLFQHEETGITMYVDDWQVNNGFESYNPRLQKIKPIYNQDALVKQVAELRAALDDVSSLSLGWLHTNIPGDRYFFGDCEMTSDANYIKGVVNKALKESGDE